MSSARISQRRIQEPSATDKASHIDVYFAYSHAPWEKGAIEHYNKMIRKFLTKGTDLSSVPPSQINRIVDYSIIDHVKF